MANDLLRSCKQQNDSGDYDPTGKVYGRKGNEKMSDKKRVLVYRILLSTGLLIAAVFLTGCSTEKRAVPQTKQQWSSQSRVDFTSQKAGDSTDVVCAILIMPKSYVSLLERFPHQRMARKIEILPANFEWNEDSIVAISKKRARTTGIETVEHTWKKGNKARVEPTPSKSRIIQGATLLYFLAEVEKRSKNR